MATEKQFSEEVVVEDVSDAGEGLTWLGHSQCMSVLVNDRSVKTGEIIKITNVAGYGSQVAKVEVWRNVKWENIPIPDQS